MLESVQLWAILRLCHGPRWAKAVGSGGRAAAAAAAAATPAAAATAMQHWRGAVGVQRRALMSAAVVRAVGTHGGGRERQNGPWPRGSGSGAGRAAVHTRPKGPNTVGGLRASSSAPSFEQRRPRRIARYKDGPKQSLSRRLSTN